MRYGDGLLEEILRRTDIVQLVGRRVKLSRKGRVFWGCCPFHKEKSASFKVENERRNYKCFGCGAGGNAFKWLQETEGLSFTEAVERLAGEAGVELPKWSQEDEAREARRKSLYEIVELACQYFEEQLRTRAGSGARAYLASRGLDDAAAKRFRLGYAPDTHTALIERLKAKSVPLDDMVAAGLARAGEDGRPARDFFFNRLIFPISDPRGRVVAFGARALEADAKPKYLNTGETPLFSKGQLLYNFAAARAAAAKSAAIVVAEGYMDVIALVCAGFEASVAPLGTALTEQQLALLWRTAPEPILAFDGDEAGSRAAHRAAHLALPHLLPGHSLRFAFLPPGEDPDSLFRTQGVAALKKVLDAAEPLSLVLWRAETEGRDFSTPERRAGLERSLQEIASRIGDSKIAGYYRRDFEQRVFAMFQPPRREPFVKSRRPFGAFQKDRGRAGGFAEPAVSQALKESRLAIRTASQVTTSRGAPVEAVKVHRAMPNIPPAARAADKMGRPQPEHVAPRLAKEEEVAQLLLVAPEIAQLHGELLAALSFTEPLLDRLRDELLNLAASGSRLESQRFKDHLVRSGMTPLLERLSVSRIPSSLAGGDRGAAQGGGPDDFEPRFLQAAAQLQEMAELGPERKRAVERFNSEATEETWRDAQRLIAPRAARGE